MITDKITALHRADILKCKADTLDCQRIVFEAAMRLPEGVLDRDKCVQAAMELGYISKEYDSMMDPSQKQRDYWTLMQPFYESQAKS